MHVVALKKRRDSGVDALIAPLRPHARIRSWNAARTHELTPTVNSIISKSRFCQNNNCHTQEVSLMRSRKFIVSTLLAACVAIPATLSA